MNALYLAQLKPSLLVMELRLDDIKEHVDALEREIKNLRNKVVKVAEEIRELIACEFNNPII